MSKAQPPVSYDSGGERGGANTTSSAMFDDLEGQNNEYGDDPFESEDLSPIHRHSGDEPRNIAEGAKDSGKDAALPAFDNGSDPGLELEVGRTVHIPRVNTTMLFL